MKGREFKDEVFGQFARIGMAFGHAKRLEIIDVLSQGERSVESLSSQIDASIANTSRHLQILAAAGLLIRRNDGNSRIYRLADTFVLETYRAIVNLAEKQIAEISNVSDSFFAKTDGAQPISFLEFDALSKKGNVILVDVRPELEFNAGHVEGAINIPVSEIAKRMEEFPSDNMIIAYCRGPYCVMAAHAVQKLRKAGFSALRLEGGLPEWRTSGRKVVA